MKLNSISGTSCIVQNLDKTASFYEALGFRMGKRDESHLTCYVNWFWIEFIAAAHTDKAGIQREAQLQNRGAGVYLHIKVESVDEFYSGVLTQGFTPEGEPEGSKASGRSFVLRDPDGYKLVFFEKK